MKCFRLLFLREIAIVFIMAIGSMYAQQLKVSRVELMPNTPGPYLMRNWKEVALGYDSLVFNLNLKGEYLPLVFINPQGVNYPGHESFGLHTVVGTPYTGSGEAINVLPAVIGASLVGIDKSSQNGYNWVLMCEDYFNKRPEENVYLNNPRANSGGDWWYETMPNVFFYQLYWLYPKTGDFSYQFKTVADRWLQAVNAMGGSSKPWKVPYMDYRAFSLSTMTPNASGVHEPEASGAIAWILYNAFMVTKDERYRTGAELAMEFLNSLSTNPAYELQLSYGAYTAARMNAELGTAYDMQKIVNWCFDVGPLRGGGPYGEGWGAILGNWGGYDVSGLIGENSSNDYAFIMNNFEQAGALVPMVRYDKRFARAIGKWVLNIANASRLFYPNYLPDNNQDSYQWAHQYDPNSYIAHEAIRKNIYGNSPFATGDAISGGWGKTNLALYGSSHVGILGSIVDTTNVPMILRLDALKTDYFHKEAYPTYLYFNPYNSDKLVEIDLGQGQHDLYDAVSGSFLLRGVSGKNSFAVPADQAVLAVITPAGGTVTYDLNKLLINDVVVDYHSNRAIENYPPRIKSLSADSASVMPGSAIRLYCTASDPENDSLYYKWNASAGIIQGSGTEILWTAPLAANEYNISCVVTDSKGARDSAAVLVRVVSETNKPPVIKSLRARPGKVDINGTTAIECSASDPDGDPITFSWHSSQGVISGNGAAVNWKSPATAGDYYVSCSVKDTSGGDAVDSVLIEVRDFSQIAKGSLIAFYPFSGNANDASGNNLNGTAVNVSAASDRFGTLAQAFGFNGVNSYITVPNNTLLNFQNAITINFWMIPGDLPNRESFLVSHGSWQNRWKVSVIPERKLRWTIKTSSGVKDLDSRTALQKDSLYNVTAVYTGSDVELYINGDLENFAKFSGAISTTQYDLTIGQMLPGDNNYDFKGILDDIRIYNYALLPSDIMNFYTGPTSVKDRINDELPQNYALYQNYPNPFNPSTRIRYSVPEASFVSLKVYDILGNEVASLVNENKMPGNYEAEFSEKAVRHSVASGIYLYRIQSGNYSETRRMVLLK